MFKPGFTEKKADWGKMLTKVLEHVEAPKMLTKALEHVEAPNILRNAGVGALGGGGLSLLSGGDVGDIARNAVIGGAMGGAGSLREKGVPGSSPSPTANATKPAESPPPPSQPKKKNAKPSAEPQPIQQPTPTSPAANQPTAEDAARRERISANKQRNKENRVQTPEVITPEVLPQHDPQVIQRAQEFSQIHNRRQNSFRRNRGMPATPDVIPLGDEWSYKPGIQTPRNVAATSIRTSSINFRPGFSATIQIPMDKLAAAPPVRSLRSGAIMGALGMGVPAAVAGYATAGDSPNYQLGWENGGPTVSARQPSALGRAVSWGLTGAGIGAGLGAGHAAHSNFQAHDHPFGPQPTPKTAALNFAPGFSKQASGMNDTYPNVETDAIEAKRDRRKYLIPGATAYAPANSPKGQNPPGNNMGPQVLPGLK